MTGIKKISLIATSDVVRLTRPKNGQIGIILQSGTVWADIDFESDEAEFSEDTSMNDNHGEYYKSQLDFEIWSDERAEIIDWIYQTRNRRVTFKIEYRSGIILLAHNLQRQIKRQSGRGKGSRQKVTFSYSGENKLPSFELVSESYS